MYRANIRKRRLHRELLLTGSRSLRLVVMSKKLTAMQCLADFPIGFGIADMIGHCVECQHTAVFAAVVAPPRINLHVDAHFSAVVTANRAVVVTALGMRTSPAQMQKLSHIQNTKREIMRFIHANPSFQNWILTQGIKLLCSQRVSS